MVSAPDIWRLTRANGELVWEGINLLELARTYGTPLFLLNRTLLAATYHDLTSSYQNAGLDCRLFYSVKTNPLPELLRSLSHLGAGAEIITEFEFWLAQQCGIPGEKIVVNGSIKTPELLRECIAAGAALINAESVRQLTAIDACARQSGVTANVGLRINPRLKSSPFDFTVSTGTRTSHIGFEVGTPEFDEALRLLRESPALRFRGLHMHIGTGIRSVAPYDRALAELFRASCLLTREGFAPEILDIGGGMNIATLKELNLWEAVRLFGLRKSPPSPVPTAISLSDRIAEICAQRLIAYVKASGAPAPQIFLEPGRSLSATAQAILLKVESVQDHHRKRATVLCNGGAMSLSLMLAGEYHAIHLAGRDQGERRRYDIMGALPTPLDIVALDRKMPLLKEGDILAVMDVGAYFTSLGNTFAGPRPAIVAIENGRSWLVRRRETFDDLVSRDTGGGAP